MLGNKVVVLGGMGFVGRAVVNELSKNGYEIKVTARRVERYRDYALFPETKVVELKDVKDTESLKSVLDGADILVNLMTDLTSDTEAVAEEDMVEVHTNLKKVIDGSSIQRVLCLSQIGADANQEEDSWLKTVGECNGIMRTAVNADVTIVRSGLLIGAGDETSSRYAKQFSIMPVCPVPNASVAVQPLWIRDFAKGFVSLVKNTATFGEKVEMVGEERLTIQELAMLIRDMLNKDDAIIFPMCQFNAKIMAMFGGLAPIQTTSKVQLKTVRQDMTSDQDFSTLAGFEPSSLEQVLSTYVTPHHIRERYNYYRKEAGREASELV